MANLSSFSNKFLNFDLFSNSPANKIILKFFTFCSIASFTALNIFSDTSNTIMVFSGLNRDMFKISFSNISLFLIISSWKKVIISLCLYFILKNSLISFLSPKFSP